MLRGGLGMLTRMPLRELEAEHAGWRQATLAPQGRCGSPAPALAWGGGSSPPFLLLLQLLHRAWEFFCDLSELTWQPKNGQARL